MIADCDDSRYIGPVFLFAKIFALGDINLKEHSMMMTGVLI